MESKPDTIKVSTALKDEVSASYADLYVTIKGLSIVSGEEAMKKAKEVNQLVEALISFGVKNEAIKLQGVRIESAGGALLKSSSAIYRLRIRCEDLNQFAGMLDVIASQKNATLEQLDWKYRDDEVRAELLKSAIEKAKMKAEQVAVSLGVRLVSVYDFIENVYDEEAPIMFQSQMAPKSRAVLAASAMPEPSLGMDIQHTKTIHVNVDIWYRVSGFSV